MGQENAAPSAYPGAVIIGGGNFVAVRFSNEELPPLFGAALRFSLAAALFFMIARVRGTPVPRGRAASGAALYGLPGFGLACAFLYYALVGLAAGTASVIMASVPLLTLAMAVAHGQSLPRPDPITTNAIGMTAGAALLWVASLAFGEAWALPDTGRTWLVLGYLVLLGSVALFILFLYVIERWTASATTYAIALMPVFAVLFGSLLAQEPITLELVGGGALVMVAVYVGALA
ncbi:MAG: EamA family transporter [Gemmatimonadota bacterium]